MLFRRRRSNLLLVQSRPHPGRFHALAFKPGDRATLTEDAVVIIAALPGQRPRVRAGTQVRLLGAIDDPTELEAYWRFEVLDDHGRQTGEWSHAPQTHLTAIARPAPWWRRVVGLR